VVIAFANLRTCCFVINFCVVDKRNLWMSVEMMRRAAECRNINRSANCK